MPGLRSVKTFTVIAAALALLGGCTGSTPTSTSWESTRVIDIEDYKILRDAHTRIGRFTAEMDREISSSQPLEVRASKVHEVVEAYQHMLPKPSTSAGMISERQAPKGNSLTDKLTRLAGREVEYTDREGQKSSGMSAAGEVARQYLTALHYLYGLDEFEQYLVRHTTSEGTLINPEDPPEQMDGRMKVFGMHGLSGIFINVSWDPATGRVTYSLGGLNNSTIPDLEREFMKVAGETIQIGDSQLIDYFKG
ncbi:MAG: hypothetical protein FJY85_00735 [Deltaproteobacteria bacterium]|nr:hypothetical protein [Deltaproteobacteria bacterium]